MKPQTDRNGFNLNRQTNIFADRGCGYIDFAIVYGVFK